MEEEALTLLGGLALAYGLGRRARKRSAEPRTAEQIRRHYAVECALAERLRAAPKAARPALYGEVYDELFRSVPDHPALRVRSRADAAARRSASVRQQLGFIRRFIGRDTVFAEIGAGDCGLSQRIAAEVKRVYALEVSREATRHVKPAANVEIVITDGGVPLPEGGVDVAFSNQVMEHLHPEDARDQLREIHACLSEGGVYLCITPNRLYGPTDISAYFDDVARGLHLREYSARDLRALLREAGFSAVRFYAGARGFWVRIPETLLYGAEKALEMLPARLRRRVARASPLRAFLGLRLAAIKQTPVRSRLTGT